MFEDYQSFSIKNIFDHKKVKDFLTDEQKFSLEVIARVLPFKVDSYVVEELIDWRNIPDDPIFQLTFLQKGMLKEEQFSSIAHALRNGSPAEELAALVQSVRLGLNPHPGGQMEYNVPVIEGRRLPGLQHKYRETLLFFPLKGQTCHAYCSFCFRWPQFVGIDAMRFGMNETADLVAYINSRPEITDLLITGGDPMVMSAKVLDQYLRPLLDSGAGNLKHIRIGSKALAYWPYRFTTDKDADDLLALFRAIIEKGYHLSFMAHFSHPVELKGKAVKEAIRRIRQTGAEIRTQSPVMRYINDSPATWAEMWRLQVGLGLIPYYMFIARDTGAHDYFAIPIIRALQIFREATSQLSGLSKTARGPVMSAHSGKVEVVGTVVMAGMELFVLRYIQCRNPDWLYQPFFAKMNREALWLTDLEPAWEDQACFFEEIHGPALG